MEQRYFCHCRFCDTAFVVNDNRWDASHSCEGLDAEKTRWATENVKSLQSARRVKFPELSEYTAEDMAYFQAEAIRNCVTYYGQARRLSFKQTVKPTKCGPKCWGAKCENCACECQGHNHGIGRAPSTV